jgi:hypothetical protein
LYSIPINTVPVTTKTTSAHVDRRQRAVVETDSAQCGVDGGDVARTKPLALEVQRDEAAVRRLETTLSNCTVAARL